MLQVVLLALLYIFYSFFCLLDKNLLLFGGLSLKKLTADLKLDFSNIGKKKMQKKIPFENELQRILAPLTISPDKPLRMNISPQLYFCIVRYKILISAKLTKNVLIAKQVSFLDLT